MHFVLPLVAVCLVSVVAIPKPNKTRVKEEVIISTAYSLFDLSVNVCLTDLQLLSEKAHFEGDRHNSNFDHDAFLGEEAKTFDQLSPEESKERLGLVKIAAYKFSHLISFFHFNSKIVDRIDRDMDGKITKEELKSWIQYTQRRYITEDVERQWKTHNPSGKDFITWDEYKKMVYGFMDDLEPNELERDEEGFTYKDMIRRDQRRWGIADTNGDHTLNQEEFTNFLHPEDAPHMRDVVVVETMEDIDKNKDGAISLAEYIGDMYRGVDGSDDEPDWVKNEREQFANYRDKNKDGRMDANEVPKINPVFVFKSSYLYDHHRFSRYYYHNLNNKFR